MSNCWKEDKETSGGWRVFVTLVVEQSAAKCRPDEAAHKDAWGEREEESLCHLLLGQSTKRASCNLDPEIDKRFVSQLSFGRALASC